MLISGEWLLCDDGVERPVLRGEVATADGLRIAAEFLVDTGADRTVLNADSLLFLGLPPIATGDRIEGVGGFADSVVVEAEVRLRRDDGGLVLFRGQYAGVTNIKALDMSVLGRDITGLFAVVVDRPGNVVCLIGQRHRYRIEQT